MKQVEKPKVLSDEIRTLLEVELLSAKHHTITNKLLDEVVKEVIQKANAYYEPIIQQAKREIFKKIKGAYRHKDQHYMRDGMIDREFRCVSEHSIKAFESKYQEEK